MHAGSSWAQTQPEETTLGAHVGMLSKNPGPMLRSMVLLAMIAMLLVGAGTAAWMAYSMRQVVLDGVLPAHTKALEYSARSLVFRVEQQQKPLLSLASLLSEHMQDSPEAMETMLRQQAFWGQQFEQIQLANAKGQLLLNLHKQQAKPLHQLDESQRDVLKRAMAAGKPMTQAWVRPSDAGLQLEFYNVVPLRNAQSKLVGVLGGSYTVPLAMLFSLESDSSNTGSQLLLLDREFKPLAISVKAEWQIPAAANVAALTKELDPAWINTAQAGAVSEQHNHKIVSAMPLPWAQWTLLKVSDVQDWAPGISLSKMGWLAVALLAAALVLGAVLCLIAYPLTALYRTVEWAGRRGLMLEVDSSVRGAHWWQALSAHDWGEAQTLRTALQALGGGYEVHGERERQLELQLQTLMDYAPVGSIVTHGLKVQRVGMQAARVLGYQPREMLGLPIRELCATDADFISLTQRVHRELETYGKFNSEVCLMRKDLSPIWVRVHGQSMRRMSMGMNTDRGAAGKESDEPCLVWELEDASAQRQLREQSRWKAMHDPLTRLPNREAFVLRLQEWLGESHSTDGHSGSDGSDASSVLSAAKAASHTSADPALHGVVLYVDIDHFSQVNRQGGREVGDEVLCHIARLIEATVRPHGWVARVGGDEFGILMAGVGREEGMRQAQLLCMAIQDWDGNYQGERYTLSASIGMLLLDASYHTGESAFKSVDMACYVAKRKGRNRVEVMAAAV